MDKSQNSYEWKKSDKKRFTLYNSIYIKFIKINYFIMAENESWLLKNEMKRRGRYGQGESQNITRKLREVMHVLTIFHVVMIPVHTLIWKLCTLLHVNYSSVNHKKLRRLVGRLAVAGEVGRSVRSDPQDAQASGSSQMEAPFPGMGERMVKGTVGRLERG